MSMKGSQDLMGRPKRALKSKKFERLPLVIAILSIFQLSFWMHHIETRAPVVGRRQIDLRRWLNVSKMVSDLPSSAGAFADVTIFDQFASFSRDLSHFRIRQTVDQQGPLVQETVMVLIERKSLIATTFASDPIRPPATAATSRPRDLSPKLQHFFALCNRSSCDTLNGTQLTCVDDSHSALAAAAFRAAFCLDAAASRRACGPRRLACVDTSLPAALDALLDLRDPDEVLGPLPRAPGAPPLPVIAVVAGATSRGFKHPSLDSSPLFTALLPSMLRTAEPGFEYRAYLGFDAGDALFDLPATPPLARARLANLSAARGGDLAARLAMHRVYNLHGKPGPAFNAAAAAAYRDGADFFYRVNDDSVFSTPWAAPLASALASFRPPYLGVVGPTCPDGQRVILTHDFTHRTHLALFPSYYPPPLADWWMDDWITAVYPGARTYRHPDVVVGHRMVHMRYKVDAKRKSLLPSILADTRRAVRSFLAANCSHLACPAAPPPPPPSDRVRPGELDPRCFRDYDLTFTWKLLHEDQNQTSSSSPINATVTGPAGRGNATAATAGRGNATAAAGNGNAAAAGKGNTTAAAGQGKYAAAGKGNTPPVAGKANTTAGGGQGNAAAAVGRAKAGAAAGRGNAAAAGKAAAAAGKANAAAVVGRANPTGPTGPSSAPRTRPAKRKGA